MVLGPKNDYLYGLSYRYIVFFGDQGSAPPDAKNLARLHLEEIGQKIDKLTGQKDSRSTTPRWPTSRRSATASTGS